MASEIIKVLDELCKKFGIAVDWTSENVLPYVQKLCDKYINYEIWTSVGWIVLLTILFVTPLIMAIKFTKKANQNGWYDEPTSYLAIGAIMVAIAMGILWCVVIACQTFDIITCLTFPEKMIVEYVKKLLAQTNA